MARNVPLGCRSLKISVDFSEKPGIIITVRMKNMSNTEMQNVIGMMLVVVGLSVFVVLTQILDVIQ